MSLILSLYKLFTLLFLFVNINYIICEESSLCISGDKANIDYCSILYDKSDYNFDGRTVMIDYEQREAIIQLEIEQFNSLVQSDSDDSDPDYTCLTLRKILSCSTEFPNCIDQSGYITLESPCRDVCEQYYKSCFHKDESVACETFPESNCVSLDYIYTVNKTPKDDEDVSNYLAFNFISILFSLFLAVYYIL
eukprot:TRINITY_DN13048_c0_g1_i1.p1 TRINITY_DN13048_c0_g1~~TRINITY_DN13048_c0_g1_i1.p1  ORF type:complete len:193 (+),score=18.03 TRINITY_DN13048_c0_g1_i1:56-634(+)